MPALFPSSPYLASLSHLQVSSVVFFYKWLFIFLCKAVISELLWTEVFKSWTHYSYVPSKKENSLSSFVQQEHNLTSKKWEDVGKQE